MKCSAIVELADKLTNREVLMKMNKECEVIKYIVTRIEYWGYVIRGPKYKGKKERLSMYNIIAEELEKLV